MSDWSRKQFAMAMVAAGRPLDTALMVAREFEFLWQHEVAYDNAFMEHLLSADRHFRRDPNHPEHPPEELMVAWLRAAIAAAERAKQESIEKRESYR